MDINLNRLSDEDIEYETVDEWPESTKVVDYLNRIRMRTIEELRKAQEETLDFYKLNSNLRHNKLVNFDLYIFDNIGKIEEINLHLNPNINKDEILNRSLQSNIKVYF